MATSASRIAAAPTLIDLLPSYEIHLRAEGKREARITLAAGDRVGVDARVFGGATTEYPWPAHPSVMAAIAT